MRPRASVNRLSRHPNGACASSSGTGSKAASTEQVHVRVCTPSGDIFHQNNRLLADPVFARLVCSDVTLPGCKRCDIRYHTSGDAQAAQRTERNGVPRPA